LAVYERSVTTPTAKLAVIRREDTFTLAPWKPALEQMRGRMVMGLIGPIGSRGRSIADVVGRDERSQARQWLLAGAPIVAADAGLST
jgi:hypothetical protein